MIPLRIKIESNARDPFVVRLRSFEGTFGDLEFKPQAFEASLQCASHDRADYIFDQTRLSVFGIDASAIDGDVLLVNPERGVADRLIRSRSPHNTLLVTERCDQLCVMCSQPPKKYHTDRFSYLELAAMLAPLNSIIGITGGEPTLYKRELFELLSRVMTERPDISFHVLTNAQHIDETDIPTLRSFDPTRIVWGVPLYSRNPEVHDEIVGKPGAHGRLLESLAILARCGAQIELRTVLMKTNADGLAAMARFVTTSLPFVKTWAIMQLESIGYARQNWKALFYDSSESFRVIGEAIDLAGSRGIKTMLYNFPLCTVPAAYRHLAPSSISDWKRAYLAECAECSIRENCGGFFEWHPRDHGYAGLRAA